MITRGSIKITREMMEKGKRLKIIGVHGMGYENVDLASANELGKIVCNTSPEILEDLIKVSDIISIHIPSKKDTFHLIGKKEFELMKDDVRIINTSRGRVIDEKELIKAIKKGKVAGAGLDVFEKEPLDPGNPLCNMDNVILTPNLSASNREGMERMAMQIAESVIAVFRGPRPKNQVII